ncbi:hypothetical protein C8N47_110129 [Mangrovibacterium marinum]|uniref:Uncharacterized protein n=1 Tax=Mangrovibacterium marinum TaxID=1639118 RepID=A0A2T5C0W0_9BACT|nr:hypothetical protein C8N47_110129 [Mangrovibacterium marinum]
MIDFWSKVDLFGNGQMRTNTYFFQFRKRIEKNVRLILLIIWMDATNARSKG